MKVNQFYNKNQFIIEGKNGIYFQSYNSMIARIDNYGTLTLGEDWDYSKTTTKHLYLFLTDYLYNLNDYIQAKIKMALNSSNKRASIQKLIDDEELFIEEL